MESTIYRNEMQKLLVKKITLEEARKISRDLWRNDRVRQLVKELGEPLDEYVRLFVGITGQTAINENQFVEFVDNCVALRKEIEHDQSLIKSYQELESVDRATPMLAIAEVAKLILIALASGAVSGLSNTLIKRFLSRRKKERAEILVQMLLSSPILSVLSKYDSGLSIREIAEETGMAEADIGYFLAKYEDRRWVSKERKGKFGRQIWRIRKRNVIQDFKP